MNTIEKLIGDILSFTEACKIRKSADVATTRVEVNALIKRARELPRSNEIVMRKVVVDSPPGVSESWDLLKMILESKNVRCL